MKNKTISAVTSVMAIIALAAPVTFGTFAVLRLCHVINWSWWLVNKWFNRYEKHIIIGMVVRVQYRVGLSAPCLITDVKIRKAGKHRLTYDISVEPINEFKEVQIP